MVEDLIFIIVLVIVVVVVVVREASVGFVWASPQGVDCGAHGQGRISGNQGGASTHDFYGENHLQKGKNYSKHIVTNLAQIVTRPFFDGAQHNQGCSVAQALCEQQRKSSERARAKSHRNAFHSPSRSPRPPWPGPGLARRAARAERPLVRAAVFLDGKAPDWEPGDRRKEESSAERGPSSSFQRARRRRRRDPLRHRPRGSWCQRNPKQKKEGRAQLERRVQGDGRAQRARLAVPTQATCGLPLLKLCALLLFRTSHAKNLFLVILRRVPSSRSIRVSIDIFCRNALQQEAFSTLPDQKNLPCASPRRDLGRLQSNRRRRRGASTKETRDPRGLQHL